MIELKEGKKYRYIGKNIPILNTAIAAALCTCNNTREIQEIIKGNKVDENGNYTFENFGERKCISLYFELHTNNIIELLSTGESLSVNIYENIYNNKESFTFDNYIHFTTELFDEYILNNLVELN